MARSRRSAPRLAPALPSTRSSSNFREAAMAEAVHLRIEGRVQGVGYRAWLEREATRAGLGGWVRNRADGSVEAVLIGDADTIDRVATACARGPRLAAVSAVRRSAASDNGGSGFHQLPTE